ncbi:ArsR/SmtB family transcription factor [Paenibacillus chartarius]|uniref:ArsR/SmtB family transcription factor n=1 Tax=Paenibacillus chartarius TaxID=747481 RepID=A0ABV6DEG2_9BACL
MDTTIWSALAESNRLRIVELLRGGPLTVGEIAGRLQLRQPQASKHLRILLEAGIVELKPEANRRIYKLRPEPFEDMNAWLKSYRGIWDDRMRRMAAYLQDWQRTNQPTKEDE